MEQIFFHISALEQVHRELLATFIKERPECAPCVWGHSGPYSLVTKEVDGVEKVIMALPDSVILPQFEAYLMEFARDFDDIAIIGIDSVDFANKLQERFNNSNELPNDITVFCGDYNFANGTMERKANAYPFEWTIVIDRNPENKAKMMAEETRTTS